MKKALLLCFLVSSCTLSRGVELSDLKGKMADQVQESYGSPVIVRYEGDYQMWAYKQKECSILVFFDSNGQVQFAEKRGNCE